MDKISQIKIKIDTLEYQINQNNNNQRVNDEELASLKRQLQLLESEKNKMDAQLKNMIADAEKNKILQTAVDKCETELRNLTSENQRLNVEIDRLKQTIDQVTKENNDLKQQQQQQINDIRQQIAQKELQVTANQAQIQNLMQEINNKDQIITQLNNEIANLKEQIQSTASTNAGISSRIQLLEQENAGLKEENNELIEKIKKATSIINIAIEKLQSLANPNERNKNNAFVNKIIMEIERLLGELETSVIDIDQNRRGQNQGGILRSHDDNKINYPLGYNLEQNAKFNNLTPQIAQTRIEGIRRRFANDKNISPELRNALENDVRIYEDFIQKNEGRRGGNKTKKPKLHSNNKHTRKQKGGFLYGKYKKTTTNIMPSSSQINASSNSNNSTRRNKKIRAKGVIVKKRK
jgi:DNA repair exonuclease SbcCD ATPase subunit